MHNEHKCQSDMENVKLTSLDFSRSQSYPYRLIFITLIFMTFTIAISLQHVIDRSIIFKNFTECQNQLDKSMRLIPCIVTFIEEYFDYVDRILLLLPDVLEDLVELLISELHTKSTVYILNAGMPDIMETHDVSANAVILSENAIALEEYDICFINYCKHNCSFVIILNNLFTDKESFLIEANRLLRRICLRSIFRFTILALVEDSILFAGMFSILTRIDESYGPVELVPLGSCEQKIATVRWQHFPDKTRSLLDTCVNAAIFENFPFAYLASDNDYSKFGGVEGLMMEEIAANMKVELNREVITWTNETKIDTELYLRLYNSTKNDLVFGGLLWNSNGKVEYTSSYGMVHVVWMVPIKTNVSLRGLITPFSANVWYAIICVLIIGGLIRLFIIRDISFLDITGLVLGVSIRYQPTKTSSRIQFIAWTLFGFFITQLYLGSLADQLMNASDLQIESMEELMSSGLKIGGTARFADLLGTPDEADEDDEEVRRAIRENFVVLEEEVYIKQILDLVEGRNSSLALIVTLNVSEIHRVSNLGYAHFMKETMGNYPLALATWRGFPYLSDINFRIQVLLQTGLVEFWSDIVTWRENYDKVQIDIDDNTNLHFEDIVPAFLLLIIGYLNGCCLLIVEIIFYPSKIL